MYGHQGPFRPGGGGRGAAQPPQHQQIHMNPNLYPNPNLFLLQQNPNFVPHFNPFLQNPNSFPQNQPQFINNSVPIQPNSDINDAHTPRPSGSNNSKFRQKEMVDKLDKAVVKAVTDLLESSMNVSSWKVSQAALLTVKAESWESLGFQMQQVPSLNNLLVMEGKINAFIHCFVAVRRITSLYDLEVAICESEGIEGFEELGLGPLVRHPLAVHYFSVTSDVIEVYRIRTEEIISYLCEFIGTRNKKAIKVDTFLDFICEKQSVSGREKLCVRVQNFGLYISHIRKAMQTEDGVLKKCYEKMKSRSARRCHQKRRLFAAQKKEMDDHFTAISQSMKSFSSSNTQFCGKHVRFTSSGSDDDSESNEYDENQDEKNTESNCSLPLTNSKSDRVSRCPYPSATEEMTRLGFKSEVEPGSCRHGGSVRCNADNDLPTRKRKYENMSCSTSLPRNRNKKNIFDSNLKSTSSGGLPLSAESLRMFITTWKETCRENNADEVIERMLQFYNTRKKRRVKELFTIYPFVGLLYAAVAYIKSGIWDNIYDTFQTFNQKSMDDKPSESSADYISINVEPSEKDVAVSAPKYLAHKHDVRAEDIVKKISGYFEDDILSYKTPYRENCLHFLRKLSKCEYWLIEQYFIDKFESLGYGEYLMFLEKYMHMLPHALQKRIIGDISENVSLEAHLLPVQLDVLLSQASNSLWQNEVINMRNISELLARQFPLVCIKLVNSDHMADFTKRCGITSNNVLFSTPLSRLNYTGDSSVENKKTVEETTGFANNRAGREGMIEAVTTKDAIEILLKAPMMIDLKLWSHWDMLFAPSLGSIVEWLLKEVNTKELLCMITKDGKVIRIDHSATMDSFLEVFIRGSSFETAVQLLSLFALYGGERNVPLSLLKCHARKAFGVIINNYLEKELSNDMNPLRNKNPFYDKSIFDNSTSSDLVSKLSNNRSILNRAASVMSKFILDCLSDLPIEFCSFAADVLIAGLQSFVNDVPVAILTECKKLEQLLMLHEVGMSLGLMEWVRDYQSFCSSPRTGFSLGSSCLDVVHSGFSTRSVTGQGELDKHPASLVKTLVSSEVDHHNLRSKGVSGGADSAKVSVDSRAANSKLISKFDTPIDYDPAKVIESIRQEEFGLDQSLSATKNSMLEKQHARLGRALHCLSHELYSQDSHFLLELVQNADDNIYLEHAEPTLTFILQDRGIIVLNNEVGFSANNIRALCDVGNSTKKGHSTGYIGKKGIGFKSVFRVTDAPEIHSNGFHIKFDITEGQVGFVLPTVVPPCDMDLYTRLASADDDCQDQDAWNTCIVLPFRSDMLGGFAMNNILSMFSDLHPSLLLFLHRLHCIKFRNLIDGSLSVMRKQVIGDGIVEVTLGNEKMTWFVVSQELNADVIRSDVKTTEISIAFTLQEMYEGGYVPILNQQPVFAFLPLRTYGLKFILQGDFVLPSSREEVDGNSPWNQWLLSEFPNLFVSAERSFCALPCYRGCPGKAITVFMSYIPLVGEVHGFFSSLPRMIVSKLRMSECLIQEGAETEWIAPCKALRNWTDQTRSLISDNLLHEHLGLRFLSKDITLSDSLANALGVEDYGPQILLRVISSLCRLENGLQSMGLSWLSSWLSTFYVMSSQFFMQTSLNSVAESDLLDNLRKIPFIPLSDGKYSSFGEDSIWLHSETVGQGINDECLLKAFPELYAKLRIVSPNLLAAATSIESSCSDLNIVENVTRMLYKVGVQRLSVHDIVKVHILPALSEGNNATGQEKMVIEYLAFAMYHLQSSCTICSLERSHIIAELHENAMILTNYGFKRPSEVPIHFNQEFGNPVDVNKLISGLDLKWHEIDTAYVKHPITKSISGGVLKWRSFFQELGVTDFVQVVQIEKSVPDVSPTNSEDVLGAKEMISTGIITKNWESSELFHLLSSLSSRDVGDKPKYLLEILDRLWDDNFSDKVTGYCVGSSGERKPFKSSFISILQDSPWIVSNIDTKLHCPKDLFHDCLAVNSVLGVSAPYTIPKVSSEKMLADLGLKTQVTPDDALSVLRLWRKSKSPFRASVSQMSNFYSFLWKEMTLSKNKIIEELHSGPFIFLPNTSSFSEEDLIHGAQLLSPHEVYWHDTIGTVNQIKSVHPVCVSSTTSSPQRKMLYNFYPNLHDFFVNECGVDERPPFCSYLQILLELSTIALPHQAAKRVFEVFIMWDDALKTGSLSFEDAEYLKESLLKKEYTVLPTRQDKWVSLHSSFGLVCWCDDDDLGTEFRDLEGVDFLHFGEPTDEKNRMLRAKVSTIMKRLGIPALSEVVTREAIYYGPADCSLIFSLVNWALPYAQRYIYNAHPDIYSQLKQSDFENIRHLKIVVVEKLFYRNVIKKYEITSKSRHSCNCLLQDKILYCTRESDQHSIFLEFSCLLSMNGTPDLHFANFLLMITRMAESGSTEEQTELFILNSQKVPKLPADESIWSLQSASSIKDHTTPPENSLSLKEEQRSSAVKRKTGVISNWPPVDWKTAPGFDSSSSFGFKKLGNKIFAEKNIEQSDMSIAGISSEFNMEVDSKAMVQEGVILEAEILETQSNNSTSLVGYSTNMVLDSVDLFTSDSTNFLTTNSTERDQVFAQQAQLTGRLGELVASKFFVGKFGEASVNWVNENSETGLPYDILLGDDENTREYIEVKATRSARKNWFLISMREWQFAIEKGESFSIAHVVLADENMAKVTVYKNPARLCQLGNLKLAFVVPK